MKLWLALLLLLADSHNSYAECVAYRPDGKKIPGKFRTIRDAIDSLYAGDTFVYHHVNGTAVFKKFTDRPLFVIFFKEEEHPERISAIIKSYIFSDYLYSYDYYTDLKSMMKDGKLTTDYLKDVFNEPDFDEYDEDSARYLTFKKFNLKVEVKDSLVKSANVINYRGFARTGLMISDYTVTGGDYSIGFKITLSNLGSKAIKYAYFTGTATNPVHDKVGTKTVSGVGPIKPGDSGSYDFENVIYSRSAQYLSLDLIKLQYMDGTFKIISKKDIRNIELRDWEEFGQRSIDD